MTTLFTLQTATVIFAEMLENLEQITRLITQKPKLYIKFQPIKPKEKTFYLVPDCFS
jgi:hypothetical protein